jgi:spermidine/putrescine transport system substrate-binding protein
MSPAQPKSQWVWPVSCDPARPPIVTPSGQHEEIDMTDRTVAGQASISRRRVLQGGALAGVAAFLAACGTKGTETTPTPAPTAAPASAGASASMAPASETPTPTLAPATPSAVVNWANWTYYMDLSDDGQTHPTLDAFTAKYGTVVQYQEVIDGNESFFGTIQPALQAGQDTGWDIITMTDWMASRLIRLGWVESLNLDNMPNFVANLKDEYKGVGWDPDGTHHAPWQSGMTGIGFDKSVTGDITSLSVFFTADPRWKGKTELLDEMRDTIGLTMLYLGLDPTNPTRDACDQAVAKLQQAKADGIIRAVKGNSYADDLRNQVADLVMAWSGDMIQVLVDTKKQKKRDIQFVVPDEGGMLWTDNSMIPKGAQHKGTAELLIDWYYIPENAALVEDYVNYICPVKGADVALQQIDPEVASNPLIFPPASTTAKLHIFGALSEDDEAYFNQQFAKVLGVG